MATLCCTTRTALLIKNTTNTCHDDSFRRRCNLNWPNGFASTRISRSSNRDLLIRKVTPEAAGDVLSSLSIPSGIPGFSLPAGDTPCKKLAVVAGLLVAVPFMVQRLLTLTKDVDMAAQTVEKIADVVGKVAEEVEKAAEDIAATLPDGGLKKVVSIVEGLAEETVKDAQKVEDLMDKVEELDDKLEEFLTKKFKGTDKA
ncbi:hypothetical protein OROGR_005601 [Orobanche gracilis]